MVLSHPRDAFDPVAADLWAPPVKPAIGSLETG